MDIVASIKAQLGLDTALFTSGLNSAMSSASQFSSTLLRMPNIGTSLLSTAGIAVAAEQILNLADNVQHLSDRYGVSTTILQQWGNAAEQNGSSMDSLGSAFNKLEVARDKALLGDKTMLESFQRLGISMDDLKKLTPDELMDKIAKSSMDAADMVKIMGKNATELRPVLEGIAAGTIKFGDAISAIDVKKLADTESALKKIGRAIEMDIGGDLAEVTTKLDQFTTLIKVAWMDETTGGLQKGHEYLKAKIASQTKDRLQMTNPPPAQPPATPETAADIQTATQKLQKVQDEIQNLRMQETAQKLIIEAVKIELEYRSKIQAVEEQINKAIEDKKPKELAILEATKKELEVEKQVTLEMKAQAIATQNLEKMKADLPTLAAIPEGQAGLDAGYSEKMVFAGGQARQAQDLQAQADYQSQYKGNFVAAQDYTSRAEDVKSQIAPLKDSEKDMSGTIKAGIEASSIKATMEKIEANTAKPAVWQ